MTVAGVLRCQECSSKREFGLLPGMDCAINFSGTYRGRDSSKLVLVSSLYVCTPITGLKDELALRYNGATVANLA
jgi:hypothetical protein